MVVSGAEATSKDTNLNQIKLVFSFNKSEPRSKKKIPKVYNHLAIEKDKQDR